MNHINLARNKDLILVAPCTANFIAKITHGIADDLASNIILASNSKILIAPSMNPYMWENKATQDNLETLKQSGHKDVTYLKKHGDVIDLIKKKKDDFDILVTQGAGSVSNICQIIKNQWET